MKHLWLMRHAKSDWNHPHLADVDRPLNARGRTAATRMGQWLAQHPSAPQHVLVSPAVRARETLSRLLEGFSSAPRIEQVDPLYPGSPDQVLAAVGQLPETVQAALVLGHNPNLERLVEIIGEEPEHFPTAAIAEVTIADVPWSLAVSDPRQFLAACELSNLWRPRVLFSS